MSLALDSNDHTHVCYKEDALVPQLMYSSYDGVKWDSTPIGFQLGHFLSIAVDSNDHAHITSYDYGGSLEYVSMAEGKPIIVTADDEGKVGQYTSIAMDSQDRPHISYWDLTNNDLKYAYYNGTGWLNETVDSTGNVGYYTSLDLDSKDLPHISYYDDTNNKVKYAYHDGNGWHIETVDSSEKQATSIAVDSNDRPHISYKWSGLKFALYDGNQWNKETVASGKEYGDHASIALDRHDNPHISYYDSDNKDLKYAAVDNILPSVGSDNSPDFGTTGDPFTFSIEALDNLAVDSVHVDWAHGELDGNLSLSKNGDAWEGTVVLDHDLEDLTYTIYLEDASGHSNHSLLQEITVLDNDEPEVSVDNSPDVGATGDVFEFNLSVFDNIEVGTVEIDWEHGETGGSISLGESGGFWIGTATLAHEVDDLSYTIKINDTSGNEFTSNEIIIEVTDNDVPDILEDLTDGDPKTGENFDISISVGDNIAVSSVFVKYFFNGGTAKNESMANDEGSIWKKSMTVPIDAMNLNYSFYIMDAAGNGKGSVPVERPVEDAFAPFAKAGDDIIIDQHQTVSFDGSDSFDNGIIVNYTWSFDYNGTDNMIYGIAANFTFEAAGTYLVDLTVTDGGGNSDTDNLTVTANDITPPDANAGEDVTIDQFETVSFDGSGSTDNVGIVYHGWEFLYGGNKHEYQDMGFLFTFDVPGIYSVTLRVKDSADNADHESLLVTVRDVVSPVANYTLDDKNIGGDEEYEIKVNKPVKLDAKISSDNVGITNSTWLITGPDTDVTFEGETLEHIFNRTGSFTITLTVRDSEGNTDDKTVKVKVIEETPDKPDDDDGTGASGKDKGGSVPFWGIMIIVIIVVVLGLLLTVIILRKNKKKSETEISEPNNGDVPQVGETLFSEPSPGQDNSTNMAQAEESMVQLNTIQVQNGAPPAPQTTTPPLLCPTCGNSAAFYPDHNCYWCVQCQNYVNFIGTDAAMAGMPLPPAQEEAPLLPP